MNYVKSMPFPSYKKLWVFEIHPNDWSNIVPAVPKVKTRNAHFVLSAIKKSKKVIQNTRYKKSHNNKARHLETTVYRGW